MESQEIIGGKRPRGFSLKSINTLLGRVGLCLVIAIDVDKDERYTGKRTRLWIERAIKRAEAKEGYYGT